MALSIPKIKECIKRMSDDFGINEDQAKNIITYYTGAGDYPGAESVVNDYNVDKIKEAAAAVGVVLPDMVGDNNGGSVADIKPVKPIKSNKPIKHTTKAQKADIKPIKADKISGAGAVVVPSYDMELGRGELPEGLADDIKTFIKEWAASNDIEDISKCDGLQWRAACLYVGEWIKGNGILLDNEAIRARGGRQYDGEKVVKLLEIFQAIAATYKKVPIHTDFISFSGISRQWFFDYQGRGLTSSSVQIVKKAIEIEKAATSAKILNSKDNPLNSIWYEKTRFGIRDNDNIQPIEDHQTYNKPLLPVFDSPIS